MSYRQPGVVDTRGGSNDGQGIRHERTGTDPLRSLSAFQSGEETSLGFLHEYLGASEIGFRIERGNFDSACDPKAALDRSIDESAAGIEHRARERHPAVGDIRVIAV